MSIRLGIYAGFMKLLITFPKDDFSVGSTYTHDLKSFSSFDGNCSAIN